MVSSSRAFVRGYDSLESEIVTECHISDDADGIVDDGSPSIPDGMRSFTAVWDTGATNTLISPHVARACNLRHRGWTNFNVVNSVERARTFLVTVGLPNGVIVRHIMVAEGIAPGCDVLIGMDIISMGDFVLTHMDGRTEFLFQVPSRFQIAKVLDED